MESKTNMKVESLTLTLSVRECEDILEQIGTSVEINKSRTPLFKLGRCIAEGLYTKGTTTNDVVRKMRGRQYKNEVACVYANEGCTKTYKKASYLLSHQEKCTFNPDNVKNSPDDTAT